MEDKQQDDLSSAHSDSTPQNSHGDRAAGSSVSNQIPVIIPVGRSAPYVAVPGIAASPPQFVTMDEIMSVSNGLKNMQLIHEIAVDKDFKLTQYEPPANSAEKVMKEAMHRAFWDLLAEELSADPPIYTRALILLEEVKGILLDLLFPTQHDKLKQELNEMIDVPFVKQQAENGALDFLGFAQFIINFMGRICAPARDEKIQELKSMTDPVQIFKGVFETLTLMRLDLANFEIEMLRSNLMAQSVTYEKAKFAEALALQGGIDSLVNTKKWLKRQVEMKPSATEKDIVLSAYLELFEWSPATDFPETIFMDSGRLLGLSRKLFELIISGSILLVTLSKAGTAATLQQSSSFKDKLLHDVRVLLQDVKDNGSLESILPNIAMQVINILKDYSNQVQASIDIDANFEQSLTELLQDIHREDHNVRRIVRQRTNEFLYQALSSSPNIPTQLPPGMSSLRSDLLSITGSIVRLYQYNLAVFNEYYLEIISKIKEENVI